VLTEGTRRALAACLYDAGFTGVARLIAEGTSDVYEVDAQGTEDAVTTLHEACVAADKTGRAQLVLVTPDGEGEWLKPELVDIVTGTRRERLEAATAGMTKPDLLDVMRSTLERGR
jgi:hypothetical protein